MISADIGKGTPLILIHGFAVDSRILQALEKTVDFSGWRRLYIELPWTKPGLDTSVSSSADVLDLVTQEITEYLQGEKFALIGNSFGALIARAIAHQQPDQVLGLATIAGVFEPRSELRDVPEKTVFHRDITDEMKRSKGFDEFTDMAVIQDQEHFEQFQKFVLPGLDEADQDIMDAIASNYALPQVPEDLIEGTFDAPSLHIFGRQDDVVGYNDGLKWADHYSRGTFSVLDGAGHNLHLEQPELVKMLLESWLKRMQIKL